MSDEIHLVIEHCNMEDRVYRVYDNKGAADQEREALEKIAYEDFNEHPIKNPTSEQIRKWLKENQDYTNSYECYIEPFEICSEFRED